MLLEIGSGEVLDWYKSHYIPLNKTKIYLCDRFEGIIDGKGGVFFPRSLEGYVFLTNDATELLARYVHESSHGSFFENFQIGRTVASLDKEVYDLEKTLFNDAKIENIIAVERDGLESDSRKLSSEEIMNLDVDASLKNRKFYEVNKSTFRKYREKTSRLKTLQSALLPYMEGFSLLVEEEILGHANLEFSEDYYLEGYNLLKPLKDEGFSSLVDYLKALNGRGFKRNVSNNK